MSINVNSLKKLVFGYKNKKGVLIELLQKVQALYGYVPKDAVEFIAKELNIYPAKIYGILTFYSQFYTSPRGKHTIKVCQGTACHVMGGKELIDYVTDTLDVKIEQTTKDGVFSIERVACLGCCGMAPVVMIDNDFYGWVTIQKMDELINKYKKMEE